MDVQSHTYHISYAHLPNPLDFAFPKPSIVYHSDDDCKQTTIKRKRPPHPPAHLCASPCLIGERL